MEVAVDRWTGDGELVGDLLHGVRSSAIGAELVVHGLGDRGLSWGELGFLAAAAAACAGGGEAVAGAFGHEGVFELGDHAEDLNPPTAVDVSMP